MNDQPDDRHDDRLGLGAFDDADAPDQWDEITARADATTSATILDQHRRGPAVWFMAAAAAVLIVVAVVAVATRSGDEVTTPATTPDDTLAPPTEDTVAPTPAPTTIPTTTVPTSGAPVVPPPTTPVATEPSTSVPTESAPPSTVPVLNQVDVWDPACLDHYGDDLSPAPDATTFDEFTTVGPDDVPRGHPAFRHHGQRLGAATPSLRTGSRRRAGRDLRDGRDDTGEDVDVTALAVIDLDGTVRWRRCLAGAGTYAGVLTGADPPTIHVALNDHAAGTSELRQFNPSNGFDQGTIPLDGLVVSSTVGGRALATLPWTAGAVEPGAEMALADVTEVFPEAIPYPDVAIGRAPDAVYYALVEIGGEVLIAATDMSSSTADLVYRGGSWSDDPADLRELPPTLRIPYAAADPGLQLLDGAGDVVWTVPGFHSISREGFNSAVADSVVLAMDCPGWTEENSCSWVGETPPEERLVAYDIDTGDELWSRPGGRSFAAIDGDRAIMVDDLDGDGELDGWRLVDLRTGDTPAGVEVTEWAADDIFFNECCGAGDYVFTHLDGGVLFESNEDRVRVWLPPEVTTASVSVDLSE